MFIVDADAWKFPVMAHDLCQDPIKVGGPVDIYSL